MPVNTVAASLHAITGQIADMTQRKRNPGCKKTLGYKALCWNLRLRNNKRKTAN